MICHFLKSPIELVRARAVGTIHNISTETSALAILREVDCIPELIRMLSEHSVEICQASAGNKYPHLHWQRTHHSF